MKIYKLKSIVALLVAASSLMTSCNDEVDNPLVDKYPEQETPNLISRKVMWIIMDGANGSVVNYARNNQAAPNLRKMADNALYTFNGLADKSTSGIVTKELGWANLMTGITSHNVSDASSLSAISAPSVVERIKTDAPSKRTAVMGADASFVEVFGKKADETLVSNDKELVDAVTRRLEEKEIPDFTVLELSGIRERGLMTGFLTDDGLRPTTDVISAITTIDSYIGQIKKLIDQRSKESGEDWLVIVTSSYGGVSDNTGESVYDMADRNTFAMAYNINLNSQLMLRPGDDELKYNYYIPVFNDLSGNPYGEVNDKSLFNIEFQKDALDRNSSYTIQFFYKQGIKWRESQHTLVSKSLRQNPQRGEGWSINNGWFRPQPVCDGRTYWAESSGIKLNDQEWHVSTIVFDGKNALCSVYIDGVLANNGGKPVTMDNITSADVPLRIGRLESSSGREGGNYYITNLQFYDIALPEDYIIKNHRLVQLDDRSASIPYWDNLIGYWPLDREADFKKDIAPDYSKYGSVYGGVNSGKSDIRLNRVTEWTSGNELSGNVQPLPGNSYYQAVFNNVDFIMQSLQWLNIELDMRWGLEGIAHSLPYKKLESNK